MKILILILSLVLAINSAHAQQQKQRDNQQRQNKNTAVGGGGDAGGGNASLFREVPVPLEEQWIKKYITGSEIKTQLIFGFRSLTQGGFGEQNMPYEIDPADDEEQMGKWRDVGDQKKYMIDLTYTWQDYQIPLLPFWTKKHFVEDKIINMKIVPRSQSCKSEKGVDKDASIHNMAENEICISTGRLVKKLTQKNYIRETTALIAHEIVHKLGIKEEKVPRIVQHIFSRRYKVENFYYSSMDTLQVNVSGVFHVREFMQDILSENIDDKRRCYMLSQVEKQLDLVYRRNRLDIPNIFMVFSPDGQDSLHTVNELNALTQAYCLDRVEIEPFNVRDGVEEFIQKLSKIPGGTKYRIQSIYPVTSVPILDLTVVKVREQNFEDLKYMIELMDQQLFEIQDDIRSLQKKLAGAQ